MNTELYKYILAQHIKMDNGCWLWLGAINPTTGYGQFKYHGKTIRVHRFIAFRSLGLEIPEYTGDYPTSEVVMHLCETTLCINPDHLKIGTQSENIRMAFDSGRMVSHGNSMPGVTNPRAILTNDDIVFIRELYAKGRATHRQLAKVYNVSKTQIGRILRNEQWQAV